MKSIGRTVPEISPFEIFQDGRIFQAGATGNSAIRSAVPENPTLGSNTKSVRQPIAEIWPFEIFLMAASRHLGFFETGNSAIRSAVPENPTLQPNMKWIGWPVAEIWPFEFFQNARSVCRRVGRSVVGRSVLNIIHCSHTLLYATLGT